MQIDKDKFQIDELFKSLGRIANNHPTVVIQILHEVLRLSYKNDPYIEAKDGFRHTYFRMMNAVEISITIAKKFSSFGSYNLKFSKKSFDDIKVQTGDVYATAWAKNNDETFLVNNALEIIKTRFGKNDIPIELIKDKKLLDLGCGSGRYSVALSLLGAKVTGVDFGEDNLEKGRNLALNFNQEVDFQKQNILELDFEDESFDFVFCNGVAHHTGNMKKATQELFRVLRQDCFSWYYVYGNGGLQWYLIQKCNKFFKRHYIPKEFTSQFLLMLGMPENRHIFIDHFYVPILENTYKTDFEKLLTDTGFSSYRRCVNGTKTDMDDLSENGSDLDKKVWGDAELRYLVKK